MCVCVLVDTREGQRLNPLPSNVCLSRPALARSVAAGRWGPPTLGSQAGGAGEQGTSSCITGGERGSQSALFFFLAWAACVGCTGGAAAEAEGFLDQPTRLGRGSGVGWSFDSLGILN